MTTKTNPLRVPKVRAMPDGPRFRASHRAVLRRLGLSASIAIALAGCEQVPEPLNWMQVPNDPEVYAFVLNQCLTATRGPQRATYNDWDEAIGACSSAASTASRYCPTGATCKQDIVTRADVRAVLPKRENRA